MKTYSISAGQYDSLLNMRGERTGRPSLERALRSLADATPYDVEELVTVEGGAGNEWYVYDSQEAADRDADDGSRAMAVIEAVDRYSELCRACGDLDDGTGSIGVIVQAALEEDPDVTEADIRRIDREAREEATLEREAVES